MQSSTFTESRLGRFTASEIHKLMKSGKKKDEYFADGAMTYIYEKIAEAITGQPKAQVKSMATEWGLQMETDAIKWFEIITGKKVQHFGANEYKFYEFNNNSGCSPDGLVIGENANVQAKCPFNSANHINYLTIRDNAAEWLKKNEYEYYAQCQFEMMCCKTDKCYFISYDDRTVEPEHRMKIIELLPDAEFVKELTERIKKATEIVRNDLEYLQTLSVNY